jgi:hypothetical protein
MTGRRWVILTITTIVIVVCIVFSIAWGVDPYGVWRSSAGRRLPVYTGSVRRSKFLMSKRYVPDNFNALILGPSSSANWNLLNVVGYRLYNESAEGANATEVRTIVDEALIAGHYNLAILILSPTMTAGHGISDGVDQVGTAQAIASIDLLSQEVIYGLRALHPGAGHVDVTAEGNSIFRKPKQMDPVQHDAADYRIDPVAVKDYHDVIQSLQRHGAAIVYVVPPNYEPCQLLNFPRLNPYLETVRAQLPSGPLINLNGPEYASLRSDSNNFSDCDHLEPLGADKVAEILDKRIPEAIAAGR